MGKAKGPRYVVPFRRRREGKTQYRKRLGLVKSGKPRLVVRKSNRGVVVQIIEFDRKGDRTLVSANANTLKKLFKWPAKRNAPTAYLAGLYVGKEAKKKNISEFVLDVGLHVPSKGSIVYAALKGAVDSGLKTNYEEEMIPDIEGKLDDKGKKLFEEVKKKISG